MSMVTGLIGHDAIVLASDSRVMGQSSDRGQIYHEDTAIKLRLSSDYTAIGSASNVYGYED